MIVPHNNKGYRLCTHDNKKHKGELSCVYGAGIFISDRDNMIKI